MEYLSWQTTFFLLQNPRYYIVIPILAGIMTYIFWRLDNEYRRTN